MQHIDFRKGNLSPVKKNYENIGLLKTQIHKAILTSYDCGLTAASNQIRTDANEVQEGWMLLTYFTYMSLDFLP